MINLLRLNKSILKIFFFIILIFNSNFVFAAEDIWKKQEKQNEQKSQDIEEQKVTIESPILSDEKTKSEIDIDEERLNKFDQTIVGLFDPEDNNFNLNMWSTSNGNDIKKVLTRINKLKLSKFSENLLFQVLFTNAYSPKKNLPPKEFIKIKIDWLIKNKRIQDLEKLFLINPEIGKESKAVKFLINENLSNANIKSACKKINSLKGNIENNYLEKFIIYCLISADRPDEAQLVYDLLKERGFKDSFFENKINFLLGTTEKTTQKISDKNLLNFYLSHITSDNFDYQPNEKTDKYIWRYLTSSNLIQVDDLENEEVVLTYERAAIDNSFDKLEIFNIYKKMMFSINQLLNVTEVHKNLPSYKARALVYQSILLSDNIDRKLYLIFLLKDLFIKDNLFDVYSDEMVNILKNLDSKKIPDNYVDLVKQTIEQKDSGYKKIKYDNDVIHRSKILKHFLDDDINISKTEKDFKSVYKKIKRNKKYFISIKDIVVLDSLVNDGIKLPKDLNYKELSSQLTVPENLGSLVEQKQLGLVMLKIIEIIGEDNIEDLDPETVYFLNRILNQLNLKKIRNDILIQALPMRV